MFHLEDVRIHYRYLWQVLTFDLKKKIINVQIKSIFRLNTFILGSNVYIWKCSCSQCVLFHNKVCNVSHNDITNTTFGYMTDYTKNYCENKSVKFVKRIN